MPRLSVVAPPADSALRYPFAHVGAQRADPRLDRGFAALVHDHAGDDAGAGEWQPDVAMLSVAKRNRTSAAAVLALTMCEIHETRLGGADRIASRGEVRELESSMLIRRR